jgi:hypothetical protein
MATLARVHLGRVRRALGHLGASRVALEAAATWHRSVGGGEESAMGDCLLAALDSAEQRPAAGERLAAILLAAQEADHAHVEVFALDAMARAATLGGDVVTAEALAARAEVRMREASHFISERDRVDAHALRQAGAG